MLRCQGWLQEEGASEVTSVLFLPNFNEWLIHAQGTRRTKPLIVPTSCPRGFALGSERGGWSQAHPR